MAHYMPTPSIRLSTNIHEAVGISEYSIGELARDGIEQAIIEDMVGVCWICGEAIHKKTHRERLNIIQHLNIWANTDISEYIQSHTHGYDYSEAIHDDQDLTEEELYFVEIGRRLSAPKDTTVEFCYHCSQWYIDNIEDMSIDPEDIPIPYQFRGPQSRDIDNIPANIAYGAEVAAVYSASYSSFLKSILDTNSTSSKDYDPGLFWWAARRRSQNLIDSDSYNWVEIALRSNAQSISTEKPPEPVLIQALDLAVGTRRFRDERENLPGIDDSIEYVKSEYCPACGTASSSNSKYCQTCFYGNEKCENKKDVCGNLHPVVSGDWEPSTEVSLQCYGCGETESPNGLTESFWEQYEPRLDDIEHLILNRI